MHLTLPNTGGKILPPTISSQYFSKHTEVKPSALKFLSSFLLNKCLLFPPLSLLWILHFYRVEILLGDLHLHSPTLQRELGRSACLFKYFSSGQAPGLKCSMNLINLHQESLLPAFSVKQHNSIISRLFFFGIGHHLHS